MTQHTVKHCSVWSIYERVGELNNNRKVVVVYNKCTISNTHNEQAFSSISKQPTRIGAKHFLTTPGSPPKKQQLNSVHR